MHTKHNPLAFTTLLKRLGGYLSGDSLNYLLGFVIYAWLVRCLSNLQYGHLSIATGIYQPFIVVVALGLDLIGPRVLAEHPGNLAYVVRRVQSLRIMFAFFVCLPVLLVIAFSYWHAHQPEVTVILVAAFSMILARAFDVGYVAVALGRPKPLVYSRSLGLLTFLLILLASRGVITRYIWMIPVLNAVGVMAGRVILMRSMRVQLFGSIKNSNDPSRPVSWPILLSGARTGIGQLILFTSQSLDVVLLNRYVDAGAVGQYAMVSRLYIFGMAVLGCVLFAFIPELVASISNGHFGRHHRKFMAASAGVGLLGALLFYFVGPSLAEALAGRPLYLLKSITPVYALAFFTMSLANPFTSFLPSLKLDAEYLTAVLIGGCAAIGSDVLLIPRVGVVGAAWGQLIGTVAMGVYSAYVVRKHVMGRPVGTLAEAQAGAVV
jgi:O-antigen/teichoic acid export membrane protein